MNLPDRMKAYEESFCRRMVIRTPLIVRVDGRAFHSFCRGMDRPFDVGLIGAMDGAAADVAGDMQGFKLGYVQSDEASFLLTDYDRLESQPWLGGVHSKIVSLSASLMTAAFNERGGFGKPAVFDGRAFNVPEADVANYFLWRARDWTRNSLAMYAQSVFSHKQLHGKNATDMHEMLHGVGKNWTMDLRERERNGCWLWRGDDGIEVASDVLPNYESVSTLLAGAVGPLFCERKEPQ